MTQVMEDPEKCFRLVAESKFGKKIRIEGGTSIG
jgi:hypothetical protein